ncbi:MULTISPECIES: ParA family protein [Vibrio]|uniref:ParA family protein n=1 Tax=Vibrio TaxID=662 RepID=UPI001EF04204|nr:MULTISPECIES: ParA family protein [Vibrio]MCF7510394.1 ParA family protein [Vibrio sp. D54]MCG6322157.1 ParA family protein [Vibrio alginolyticus]MDW1497182.1 ParA family protein [Vibrio sp. YT-19(2023)]
MKLISVFNNKGGVGKSTLTYHLGAALAERGVKTLLVDLDPQSNLTLYGLTEEQLEKIWMSEDDFIEDFSAAKNSMSSDEFIEFQSKYHSIHYLLKPVEDGESDEKTLPPPVPLNNNLGLIPGRLTLHMFENKISKQWSEAFLGEPQALRTVTAIRKKCEQYATEHGYEVILIDTSPSLSALNKVIISNADAFMIPCAPDMFSDYGIKNIGNALNAWKREFDTMYGLLTDSKRSYFPASFVQLLGYTVYNAKKRSDASNELGIALAHYNYAQKLPETIQKHVPDGCFALGLESFQHSMGNNAVIYGHGTLPTMAQKYRVPMWSVPDQADLGGDKQTISGNKAKFYSTKDNYLQLADDILNRLSKL